MEEQSVSKDFVFKTEKDGRLSFVGDFEGFYNSVDDPWGQEGTDGRLNAYYEFSRSNLISTIGPLVNSEEKSIDILEVGCGLGYVLSKLDAGLSANTKVAGMDISSTAIEKAKSLFPLLEFVVGDICSEHLKAEKTYDIVIMSQILWYILEKLPQVFTNIDGLLKNNGFLIFVMPF